MALIRGFKPREKKVETCGERLGVKFPVSRKGRS